MTPTDVDMEGLPIDQEMRTATDFLEKRAQAEPTFAGMWLNPSAREIHLAFTDDTSAAIIAALQASVPREIHLRAHDAEHSSATLEALHQAYSDYMEQTGYSPLYTVDSGVRIKTNQVHANLEHTTPPEVVAAIRKRFEGMPLQIDLTTSRWTAY
jgi:hypothetical protein